MLTTKTTHSFLRKTLLNPQEERKSKPKKLKQQQQRLANTICGTEAYQNGAHARVEKQILTHKPLPSQNVISQEDESDNNDVNHLDGSGDHNWTTENPISIVPNNLRNNDVQPNYTRNPQGIYLPSRQKMLQIKTQNCLNSQQQRESYNIFRQKTPEPCLLPKEGRGITEVVASLQESQNVACQLREISTISHANSNAYPQQIGSTQVSTSITLSTPDINQHCSYSQPIGSLSSNQGFSIMNPEANGPLIHHRVAQNILPAQSHTHFQPSHSKQHLTKWKEKELFNSLGVVNNWPESLGQNQQKASINQNYCQEGFVPPATQQMIHPPGLHQQLPTTREQYTQPNNCTNRQQPSSENVNGHQQPIHNGNNANQQTARPQYSDSYHHQPFFLSKQLSLSEAARHTNTKDPLKWNEWSCMFSSAIHQNRDITDNERMSYLQTLVVGPAREAISGYLCNPGFYHDALSELERRFGNPQHVVAALTKELELWQRPQASDHATLISYASFLRKLVQTFNAHGFYADLYSTYLVRIARDKLPWSLKMKWSEHLVDNGSPFPGLEDLSIWIDKQARACEHLQDNSFSSNQKNNGNHDKNDRNRGKFNHKSNFRHKERNGNQKFSQSGFNKNHHNQNSNNNNQNANEYHHNNANRAKTFESNNSSFVHKPFNQNKENKETRVSTKQKYKLSGRSRRPLHREVSKISANVTV